MSTRNDASGAGRAEWRVSAVTAAGGSARWVTVSRWPAGAPLFDAEVRLGVSESGRLFVTGLRIGAPDSSEPYEIKDLRSIHLGDILRAIREAIACKDPAMSIPLPPDGRTFADYLRDSADPAYLTVRRGPKPDEESYQQTLALVDSLTAQGYSKTDAVAEASQQLYLSESQVWRRLARARKEAR
jgi:hypothetical protein